METMRSPCLTRFAQARLDGAAEAAIHAVLHEPDGHCGGGGFSDFGRAIFGSVVHHDDVGEGLVFQRLFESGEKSREIPLFVIGRQDDCDVFDGCVCAHAVVWDEG